LLRRSQHVRYDSIFSNKLLQKVTKLISIFVCGLLLLPLFGQAPVSKVEILIKDAKGQPVREACNFPVQMLFRLRRQTKLGVLVSQSPGGHYSLAARSGI